MKKNLIFDLGGVLMEHDIPKCISKLKDLLGDNFPKPGIGENGEGDRLMQQFENGDVGEREFLGKVIEWCRPGTKEEDIRDAWNTMHKEIPQYRLNILKRLNKEGYRLYLLSNNNETHWNDVTEHYEIDKYFEAVFLSFKEHLVKPDPAFYRLAMERTGAAPEDIIFIDDLEANRKAAKSVGWSTCACVEELLVDLLHI